MHELLNNITKLNTDQINLMLKILFGAFLSALLTYSAIPKIIRISYRKKLMASPGKRSSHKNSTPNLGGIGIFFGVIISMSIFTNDIFDYVYLLPSLLLIFFTGVMDDILVISPVKKLYTQFITAALISIGSGIRIDNFFGILGIYEINYYLSIIFTVTVVVFLVNSYNLIDGIDGLAGGIGILACLSFAFSFFKLGVSNYENVVLCFILLGSLVTFLYFNFSKRNKIFMGDTGSLFVGFILSFLMIKFISLFIENQQDHILYHLHSAPVICIAVFIIPIVDPISVSILRIINKKGPFQADKNHTHHRYLDLGWTHKKSSIVLISLNFIIILICFFLRHINVNLLLLIILTLGVIVSFAPAIFNKKVKFFKEELDNKPIGLDI